LAVYIDRLAGIREVLRQRHELVAAEPRHGVGRTQGRAQPLGDHARSWSPASCCGHH
jgi:hypothetical protein